MVNQKCCKAIMMQEKKYFTCGKCSKSFVSSTNLNRHYKCVHDKIRDIKCEICDYAASNISDVRRHTKVTHLQIKNFSCDECEFASVLKSDLIRHKRSIHIDVNQDDLLVCMECDKSFVNRKNL